MSQNHRHHRLGARLTAFSAALFLLAGCSSAPSPSATTTPSPSATTTSSPSSSTPSPSPTATPTPSSTATSPACTAADSFGDALTNFKDNLEAGAAVEDVRAGRDQLIKAYNGLTAALSNVSKDHLDALASAETRLEAAVTGIPDDDTLAQALDSLKQETNNVQAALGDVLGDINC